ncbi:class I adenylate-forming enzyme family protein [Rhodococcus rhodochrous]|uniref:class I adenylate-forming enzyme family protein n=1 Tax=Rhodococcus rhodochrous TaxID=1829 RepID=UPI000474B33D|nr:class I adenylate-forming enzyme family protein [Rhodococcus rhodochrous]
MNLTMLLEMAAGADPERVAVGTREDGITYGELFARSTALADRFRRSGAQHVAFLDLNSPSVPTVLFAAAAAGIPFAPLNYRLTDEQIDHSLGRLEPVIVVAGESSAPRIDSREGVTILGQGASSAEPVPTDVASGFVDPDESAVLLFTSGTTGAPKAAVLRHRHLTNYIVTTVEFWNAGEDEAILVSVPNYHIAGISSILSSVYSGRRIVYMPSFNPEEWVRLAAREAITHAMVVPTMLGRILDVLETTRTSLPVLRSLSYGGGRMPVHTVERAMRLLPSTDFVNAYGLTETSSTISVLGPDDHRDALASDDPAVRARLGSVGRPLPTLEISIRDGDGREVPVGEAGEVFVRGEQVAGEYTSHSALDEDGWYPTRDRGHLDSGGFLFLDGRADDVIVRGAENISPGEIEDVLVEHPMVAEAAAIGVPDREWGERIEVVIVTAASTAPTETELQEWVRARLRSTRVPTRVHFWDELPYNDTGKLLRRVLRDALVAHAEMQEVMAP